MLPHGEIAAFAFLCGLVIGSFLNVCIARLPDRKSVVRPSSRCPKCGTPIKPWDNIPVLSYTFLRGKCRACKVRISPVYPAVELLTGLLFFACYFAFGNSLLTVKWAVFSAILVVLVFTDWRERILPDTVNFTGLGIGLLLSFFIPPSDGAALWIANRVFEFPPPRPVLSFVDALIGAAVGSGLLFATPAFYFWLKGVYISLKRGKFSLRGISWQKGMGMGDIKMIAMIGTFLGAWMTILTILVGSIVGSLFGFCVIAVLFLVGWKKDVADRASRMGLGGKHKLRFSVAARYQLPFGTYLGIGAIFVVFFGTPIVAWYESLFLIH